MTLVTIEGKQHVIASIEELKAFIDLDRAQTVHETIEQIGREPKPTDRVLCTQLLEMANDLNSMVSVMDRIKRLKISSEGRGKGRFILQRDLNKFLSNGK